MGRTLHKTNKKSSLVAAEFVHVKIESHLKQPNHCNNNINNNNWGHSD